MIILLVVVPVIVVTSDVFAHPTSIAALHADDSVFHTHGVAPEAVGAVAALVAALAKLAPDLALTLKRGHVAADHIGIEDVKSATSACLIFWVPWRRSGLRHRIWPPLEERGCSPSSLAPVAAPRLVQTGGMQGARGVRHPPRSAPPGNRLQDRRI